MFSQKKLKLAFSIFVLIVGILAITQMGIATPFVLGGVILQGILGGFSGKVGPVVGGKWKDIDYMRGYVIPENPNTPAQQTVRLKFAKMVLFARALLSMVLQPFWDPYHTDMSGFNAFISENYSTLDGSNDLVATSLISKGTLETLHTNVSTYDTATGDINCQFTPDISGNGEDTDLVFIVAYDKNLETFVTYTSAADRSTGQIIFTWLTGKTATNVLTWVFAYRGTGAALVVSDSVGDICAAP